jgi:nicotinamidase/pyrazinamidase
MPLFSPTTALLVVDVQNDFADPAGALSVREGHAILPFVEVRIGEARAAGALVVYTQDWHPPHTPHFAQDGGVWPVHCVMGTWGAELHPGLTVAGPIIRKGSNGEDGYSGFTMRDPVSGETIPTELADLLRAHDVTDVVICGLATDYCVVATALDARALAFSTTVLAEGVRAVELEPGDAEAAVRRMRATGVTVLDEVRP